MIRRMIFGRGHTQYFNVATLTTVPVSHENESSSIYSKQSRLSNNDNLTIQQKREGCRLGIDTHADSSCAGQQVRILEFIDGKRYNVTPFHDLY